MTDRAALIRIAKAVMADMDVGRLSDATQRSMRALDEDPEHVLHLVDVAAREGKKKRPSDRLIGGCTFLLSHGLEMLRYAVERGDAETIALVDRLRQHLIAGGETGRITPPVLLLILHQFAAAKLEIGDDLRNLMQMLMENDRDARAVVERGEAGDHFARMAEQFGGDPFAIHACLDESVEAMPEGRRAGLVMAALGDKEPAIREGAVGFLLSASAEVRERLIELLELAAPHGLLTATSLRRMIAMRNWLPPADRDGLDKAIKAVRKKAIECAPWPRASVRHVLSSGIDGSGAFTLLVIAEEAGRALLAGILIKQGFGVRDAWVRRNVTTAELREIVGQVADETGLAETDVDYVKTVCCQALAINLEAGYLPPFGLLDCAEAIGLADLNPEALTVEKLVADLIAKVDAKCLSAAAVTKTLRQSADWPEDHPTLETWFEDNVAKATGSKRAPRAKQMAKLLAGPLQARRRRWAELAGWMALSLKHRRQPGDWQGFAILARELLGTRPLEEIGLMTTIADTTLAVMDLQGRLGTRHAA
ncbi:MAG: hypothetical protein F9K29_01155 [Hyphomicrobiaceae bacterium]|nr:MAG: hypothetical protein F9K29_01155 [Hyphomicrobiaceae bacterium]